MTNPGPVPAASEHGSGKRWHVGTLSYDTKGLINVFTWMLWGDFCLYLMDAGVGLNLGLVQLQKFGASKTLIAIVNRSIIELLIVVMVPIVSTWSDRHRGPLGRRIPFMLYATPPLAIFLALLGFSPSLAHWLRSVSPHLFGAISAGGLTIALLTIMFVGYKFFDIFPQTTYYYLWADVIPPEVMGTFSCLFRVFSTLGLFVFHKWLLKYCDDHPGAICLGAASLYVVSFFMLCWQVKEGHYPPPEPSPRGRLMRRSLGEIKRFVKESYGHSFYWKYYLFNLCFNVGFVPFRDFLIFYAEKDLHLKLGAYGNVMAVVDIVQVGIYLVMGPVVDKLHPVRAGLWGYLLVCVSGVGSFLFIRSESSFAVWVMITFGAVALFQGATTALGPRLLPRSHYGQFGAASALVFHFGQMLLTPVAGLSMDTWGNGTIFPWFVGFSALGTFFLYLVYRDWKRFGGDEAYVPPLITQSPEERAFELITKH